MDKLDFFKIKHIFPLKNTVYKMKGPAATVRKYKHLPDICKETAP